MTARRRRPNPNRCGRPGCHHTRLEHDVPHPGTNPGTVNGKRVMMCGKCTRCGAFEP